MTRPLVAVFAAGLIAGFFVPAFAHDEFDRIMNSRNPEVNTCCSEHEFSYQPAGAVEVIGAGWYLHTSREVMPFDNHGIKQSCDGGFVRCRELGDKSKTRCLFVPPGGS